MRIHKFIAESGYCSRRAAEDLIREGKVLVNKKPAVIGQEIDPEKDCVYCEGHRLRLKVANKRYFIFYKPRGVITAMKAQDDRSVVADLIGGIKGRVYPIGRLDRDSEGLLLLTDDGEAAQKLTHPAQQVEKVYHLWVSGFTPGAERRLERPIVLDGRPICPPGVRLLHQSGGTAMLEITIHEGRNRQIRRMCQSAGLTVTRLKRIREGRLSLGGLEPGCWRLLTAQEQEYLNSL